MPDVDPRATELTRLLAELRGGIERHALVAAERDRLRYRAAPIMAVDRALQRPGARWLAKPAKRAWGAARRAVRR